MSEVKNRPRIRFPDYLEEFKKIKLGDISDFISKGTTPRKFIDQGVNFIKIESLLGLNILKDKCAFISEKTHLNELKRSILKEHDILFAIAGATIGKIGIVTKNILPANTNQALSIIRLKDKSCIPYILQVLESKTMKKYIVQSISVGAQPNLNLKQINDFEFYSPSISEQQKIADFLTALDKRIELLEKKKTLLETYKKGVMKKTFNQEIRFKDDNGNDFPDWEEKRLGDITNKKSSNISANSIEFNEGDFTIYGATGELKQVDFYEMEKPYISIVKDGSGVGRVNLCKPYSSVLGTLDILINNESSDLNFVYHFLSKASFLKYVTGSSIPHIYYRDYSKLKLSVPTIKEQVRISKFLSSIDNQIELLETQIDKSKTWKKGLLQKMFV